MKKCQNCGNKNADGMNFCSDCGTTLKNLPQMVVPLGEITDQTSTEQITDSFGAERETETVVANRFQPRVPTISTQKPQSSKKIFVIFGGIFAIILLIFTGAFAMLFFYFQSKKQIIELKPTPAPTRRIEKETPTRTPSVTPESSPEKTPEVTFTPPEEPTQKDSFTISANREDWQLSEIYTVSSETFNSSSSGTIRLAEIKGNISPKGVNTNKERRIYKQFPTGALLMRTRFADGKTSNIQSVSVSDVWENYPEESGRLEFLINDNAPENNDGKFIVTIEMVSVPE